VVFLEKASDFLKGPTTSQGLGRKEGCSGPFNFVFLGRVGSPRVVEDEIFRISGDVGRGEKRGAIGGNYPTGGLPMGFP